MRWLDSIAIATAFVLAVIVAILGVTMPFVALSLWLQSVGWSTGAASAVTVLLAFIALIAVFVRLAMDW